MDAGIHLIIIVQKFGCLNSKPFDDASETTTNKSCCHIIYDSFYCVDHIIYYDSRVFHQVEVHKWRRFQDLTLAWFVYSHIPTPYIRNP